MTDATPVPAGYLRNSAGHLVPESLVKAEHLLEDELVRRLHAAARAQSLALAELRAKAFAEIDEFLGLLDEKYGAKRPETRGNLTLNSYDGSIRVQVAVGDYIAFGPELQVAKGLIDECLTQWSEGAQPHLRTIVLQAFDVGKEGKVRTDRVLRLRQLDIVDTAWTSAMEAINAAIRVSETKRYLRFYSRPAPGREHVQVALDIARV